MTDAIRRIAKRVVVRVLADLVGARVDHVSDVPAPHHPREAVAV
jgi:hypothetical protein